MNKSLFVLFLEMAKKAEVGNPIPQKGSSITYGYNQNAITFYNEDVSKLDSLIDNFWKLTLELYETVGRREIESIVIEYIREMRIHGKEISSQLIDRDIEEILKEPIRKWQILRKIHGITFEQDMPCKVGPFVFYNFKKHKVFLNEKYPFLEKTILSKEAKFLVEIECEARDNGKAQEIANEKFRLCENFFSFLIGRSNRYHIGIFTDIQEKISGAICYANKYIASQHFEQQNIQLPIDITDPFISKNEIWKLMKRKKLDPMQERISSAIEWIGKANNDLDDPDAFVQYNFAIEALLTFREKGLLITPSIANQICEYSAFLLASDFKGRNNIDKKVKEIYSIRSSIAHGHKKRIMKWDLAQTYLLSKSLTLKLLDLHNNEKINSMEQLRDWVLRRKYGYV